MSVTRPITRAITRPLTTPLTGAGVGGFNPRSLFGGGEKGFIYDFTDIATLYQDSARTTLVTATGQPIGSVSDLSPNGLNAAQTASGSEPTYNGYATFDGSNDFLVTSSLDLTGTDAVTVIIGLYKASDAAVGFVLEHSATVASNNGTFSLTCPQTAATANARFQSKGTSIGLVTPTVDAAPSFITFTAKGDISTPLASLAVNGGTPTSVATSQGTGNYGNYPLYLGRRGGTTSPFNGRMYRVIVIGRLLTANETSRAEAWCSDPFS